MLLRHFGDHVIAQMRIMPMNKKSPWEINNLTSAMITLARLTYVTSQQVSQAALANLQALLALSANHLAAQPTAQPATPAEYWQAFAARSMEEAKQSLQVSLRNETRGPCTAKYKEQKYQTYPMANRGPTIDPNVFTIEDLETLGTRKLPKKYRGGYS